MNERSTSDATPTAAQRGVASDSQRGLTRTSPVPSSPEPLQSIVGQAIWVYRSDRFAFNRDSANGWGTSYGFRTLQELVNILMENGHAERKINKLGICAHADVGGLVQISTATDLTAGNIDYPDILLRLTQLETFLTTDAQVIFFSCAAGQGEGGTRLLQRLSRLWQHRTIIGFTTFGYLDTSFGAMNSPGNLYDTEQVTWLAAQTVAQEIRAGRRRVPRMNENNRTAKWVRSNNIIRTPEIDV